MSECCWPGKIRYVAVLGSGNRSVTVDAAKITTGPTLLTSNRNGTFADFTNVVGVDEPIGCTVTVSKRVGCIGMGPYRLSGPRSGDQ